MIAGERTLLQKNIKGKEEAGWEGWGKYCHPYSLAKPKEHEVLKRCFGGCLMQQKEPYLIGLLTRPQGLIVVADREVH